MPTKSRSYGVNHLVITVTTGQLQMCLNNLQPASCKYRLHFSVVQKTNLNTTQFKKATLNLDCYTQNLDQFEVRKNGVIIKNNKIEGVNKTA